MLNPNILAAFFFLWMLTYFLVDSYSLFIDKKKTEIKFEVESINRWRNTRFIVYLAVGVVWIGLIVLALIVQW